MRYHEIARKCQVHLRETGIDEDGNKRNQQWEEEGCCVAKCSNSMEGKSSRTEL